MLIDRADKTMSRVHEANLEAARKLGMTLSEWHQHMSELGNSVSKPPDKNTGTIIYNSADYVLSYLFPPNRKKKK